MPAQGFPATRASLLLRLHSDDGHVREQAFDAVVGCYWKPIYRYLRFRWQLSPVDAEDATQAFLVAALEKGFFARFDPARAMFRTFLRVVLDRFVQNQLRDERRARRGGEVQLLSLDFQAAEGEIRRQEPSVAEDLDEMFRRDLVRAIFTRAVERVRAECDARGRALAFSVFSRHDLGDDTPPSYAALAAEFSIPVTQVTNFLASVRRQLRSAVLDEVRALTSSDEEFRAEARDLLGLRTP